MTTNGVSPVAAGGVWNGTLVITTNDPVTPSRTIQLAGWWQHQTEHENEPGLQTLTNLIYGWGTTIASTQLTDYPNIGGKATYYGEEIRLLACGTRRIRRSRFPCGNWRYITTKSTPASRRTSCQRRFSVTTILAPRHRSSCKTSLAKASPFCRRSKAPLSHRPKPVSLPRAVRPQCGQRTEPGQPQRHRCNHYGRTGHAMRITPCATAWGT